MLGWFPSFDSSLSKHLHLITAHHYTHFLQHCPAYPSFIVLVISSVVSTDSSQLHASDFQRLWESGYYFWLLSKCCSCSSCSMQEWCACWVWDGGHSASLSCFHQVIFTFFPCRPSSAVYPRRDEYKNSWQSPGEACAPQRNFWPLSCPRWIYNEGERGKGENIQLNFRIKSAFHCSFFNLNQLLQHSKESNI